MRIVSQLKVPRNTLPEEVLHVVHDPPGRSGTFRPIYGNILEVVHTAQIFPCRFGFPHMDVLPDQPPAFLHVLRGPRQLKVIYVDDKQELQRVVEENTGPVRDILVSCSPESFVAVPFPARARLRMAI
jgi:hypothetical protein